MTSSHIFYSLSIKTLDFYFVAHVNILSYNLSVNRNMKKVNPHHIASSGERYTPEYIVKAVKRVYGTIQLDPASCSEANKIVKAYEYYSPEDGKDGLQLPWNIWNAPGGNTIFLNPPGSCPKVNGVFSVCDNQKRCSCGLVGKFWNKAIEESKKPDVHIMWLGFTMNQLQSLQNRNIPGPTQFPICFLKNRIPFLDENLKEMNQPSHANYVTLLTKDLNLIARFCESFEDLGTVTIPANFFKHFA